MQPKVSVIIPVYNVEKYLRECLDSVVNQTLKDIEIICVDDGSTDNSLEILNEYAQKDNRIQIFTQENQGAGAARNKGLEIAKGEYLYFLDSDDYIDYHCLESLYKSAFENNADIAMCKHKFLKDNIITDNVGSVKLSEKGNMCLSYKDYPETILQLAVPNLFIKIFKSEFINKYNIRFQEIKTCNDVYFDCLTRILAEKITFTGRYLATYRIDHVNNLTSERGKSANCLIEAFNSLKHDLIEYGILETVSKSFYTKFIGCFRYEYSFCNREQAVTFLNNALNFLPKDYHGKLYAEIYKVSIIVPVYNVEKYLSRCLDSIVNQTLQDIEIICVNDGSTDGSLEILKEYASKDKRIKIINQENQGLGAARNSGIKVARGAYIGFVDSDDWIDKNYYESLFKKANFLNADIARCGYIECVDEQCTDSHFNNVIHNACAKNRNLGINEHSVVVWNAIYRKNFLETNKILFENINCAEDIPFTCKTTFLANKIVPVEGSYYYYNQDNPNQLSKMSIEKIFAQLQATQIVVNFLNSDNFIKKEDYIPAYKRCIWRLDNIFKLGLKEPEFTDKKKRNYLKQFVSIIHSYRYNDINLFYEIESSLLFLLDDDINSYIYFIIKKQNSIVSLTSCPARIDTVNQTIESLLNQSVKANRVILWLAEEQFPNKEKDLPQQLLDLVPKGLTIDWCEDIKSYKKLIPTLKKYPNEVIVTADDDLIYYNKWLEQLFDAYQKNPNYIHCHRAHYLTFKNKQILPYKEWKQNITNVIPSMNNFFTGVGGVLYPPKCFHKDILKKNLFMKLCPQADNICFWTMCVLNNKKINVVTGGQKLKYIEGTQETALWLSNVNEGNNDIQLNNIIKHYPKLLKKLDKDNGFYTNKIEKLFSVKNKDIRKVITIFRLKIKFKSRKLIKRKAGIKEVPYTFLENIFSVKNINIHKVITILGIKMKFKNKKLIERQRINCLENLIRNTLSELQEEKKNNQLNINNLKEQNIELQKILKEQQEIFLQKNNDLKNDLKLIHENNNSNIREIKEQFETYKQKINNVEKIRSEVNYIRSWQQNFYKDIPDEFPVRLSDIEKQTICKYLKDSGNYLEFGSGGSTFLALENSNANVFSVESDKKWLDYLLSYKIINNAQRAQRLKFYPINIGEIKGWGYPVNDNLQENYPNYSAEVFRKIDCDKIDTVLIDGRFRVACTIQAVLNCSNIKYILIHDYIDREFYHTVEEFLDKIETIDTLAVFKVKENIDYEKLKKLYDECKYYLNEYFVKIPIVFASDQNYLKYTYIAMLSALENKNTNTFYDFYILIPKVFDKETMLLFESLSDKYKNCKINFIEMGAEFLGKKMQISHITSPTYYRLKLAEILPQYERAIYMDSDVIVLKDLSEYFNLDLGKNYIAGVKAAGYILNPDGNKKLCEKLGIKDIYQYINAGVTLWNLEQIRQDNIQEKLIKLSENDYSSMDQDIINIAFYDNILHIPYKYNVMTKYKTSYLDNPDKLPEFFNLYGKENMEEALKSPVIIHYADKAKPWNSEVWLGEYWLKYAKRTPYYKNLK